MLLLQKMMLLLPLLPHHLAADEASTTHDLLPYLQYYYQSLWKERMRFTTTPKPGQTPDPESHKRKVYPCYCYKPPQMLIPTTKAYEKYMSEPDEVFIFNR